MSRKISMITFAMAVCAMASTGCNRAFVDGVFNGISNGVSGGLAGLISSLFTALNVAG